MNKTAFCQEHKMIIYNYDRASSAHVGIAAERSFKKVSPGKSASLVRFYDSPAAAAAAW